MLAPSWQVPDGDIHGTRCCAESGVSGRGAGDDEHPDAGRHEKDTTFVQRICIRPEQTTHFYRMPGWWKSIVLLSAAPTGMGSAQTQEGLPRRADLVGGPWASRILAIVAMASQEPWRKTAWVMRPWNVLNSAC